MLLKVNMGLINIIKRLLFVASIVFIFFDWRIALTLFSLGVLFHAIPLGPERLLVVIIGYLLIGGVIFLFFNWKIGVVLIIFSGLVAKFNIWANKVNYKYYHHKKD